jgi:hypothetical protein
MRHRFNRRGNVVALIQPAKATDIHADIKNMLVAQRRLQTLLATLATRRWDGMNAFLRAFAADLAKAGDIPDKALVDTHVARFALRKGADDELAKRVEVLNVIRVALEHRIGELAKTNHDEMIELLKQQIAALERQPKKPGSDQDAVNQGIAILQDELDRLLGSAAPKPAAAARKRKK